MRLKIPELTLKKLFALSGNSCAFPGCNQKIVSNNNLIIGNICHIEAASPGGLRYNPQQSDDERASFENLILLCPNHHKATDDITEFSVEKLKQMKNNHESCFLSNQYEVNQIVLDKLRISQLFSDAAEIESQIKEFFTALILKPDPVFSSEMGWGIPDDNETIASLHLDLIRNYELWYHTGNILIQKYYPKKENEFVELCQGKEFDVPGFAKGYTSKTTGICDIIHLDRHRLRYQSKPEMIQDLLVRFTRQQSILRAVLEMDRI